MGNYRYFVVLIYSATIFLMVCIHKTFGALDQLTVQQYGENANWSDWGSVVLHTPTYVIFVLYCLLLMVAVLLLSFYHTVVSLQNLTTNEHVKNYYRTNPFDYGARLNCLQIYCRPH